MKGAFCYYTDPYSYSEVVSRYEGGSDYGGGSKRVNGSMGGSGV